MSTGPVSPLSPLRAFLFSDTSLGVQGGRGGGRQVDFNQHRWSALISCASMVHK